MRDIDCTCVYAKSSILLLQFYTLHLDGDGRGAQVHVSMPNLLQHVFWSVDSAFVKEMVKLVDDG